MPLCMDADDWMIVLDTMHRVPTPAHFISVLIC